MHLRIRTVYTCAFSQVVDTQLIKDLAETILKIIN